MTPDARANSLAARQGGILRRDQALDCGFTEYMIRHRVRTEQWRFVGAKAYRLLDLDAPRDRLRAAAAALPNAVVSHESAGVLHSIPTVHDKGPIVTVHSRTTHVFPGVKVHRNHDLREQHTTRVDDLPVTTLPRTVVDLAAVLSKRHLEHIVDDLLAASRVSIPDLETVHAAVARKGKPGSAAIREILRRRVGEPSYPGSRLESLGLGLLTNAGLPRPESEYPIPWSPRHRFDLAYPNHKLAIEWDSRRWHSQLDAFESDRRRDQDAVLNGWRVLRFTWSDVTGRPQGVATAVRRALGL